MGTATASADVGKLIAALYETACGTDDWPQLDSAALNSQQWQELLPHLQRALCLQQRLREAQLAHAVPPALVRAVHLVIASAGSAPQCQSLRLARKQQTPLALTVTLLAACQPPCALLIARDPAQASTSVPALRQLFDLTQAEALVGKELAQGATIEEIAARSGISVNTVKTHLHHTYLKTDTRRQGELIALIHGATAHLAVLDV